MARSVAAALSFPVLKIDDEILFVTFRTIALRTNDEKYDHATVFWMKTLLSIRPRRGSSDSNSEPAAFARMTVDAIAQAACDGKLSSFLQSTIKPLI